jgi:hypothetical protein
VFGGLAASGWHVSAIFMKLTVANFKRQTEEALGARSLFLPDSGFDNLKWLKPVLAGDTLTYLSEVTALRVLESRPAMGACGFPEYRHQSAANWRFPSKGKPLCPQAVCVHQPGYCKSAARSCHGEGGRVREPARMVLQDHATGNYIQS